MSPAGCPKMSATPCNRNADESFPVLRLKSREQKSPTPLLIQDKDVLQPSVDLLHGDQRPGLPGMAWLPPTLAATRPPACAFRQRLWRITRRRPRGVLGVLLEAFEQSLDCSLQFGNARFEGADILADGKGRLLPQLRWERGCGVHGPASYATWIPVSKPHGLRPRERLPPYKRIGKDWFFHNPTRSSVGSLGIVP